MKSCIQKIFLAVLLLTFIAGCVFKREEIKYAFQMNPKICGDFFLYSPNEDRDVFLTISADRMNLMLTDAVKTFDIEDVPKDAALSIEIHEYDRRGGEKYYCMEKIPDEWAMRISRLIATSGEMTITISTPDSSAENAPLRMSIELNDIVFRDEKTDEEKIIRSLLIDNVILQGLK